MRKLGIMWTHWWR